MLDYTNLDKLSLSALWVLHRDWWRRRPPLIIQKSWLPKFCQLHIIFISVLSHVFSVHKTEGAGDDDILHSDTFLLLRDDFARIFPWLRHLRSNSESHFLRDYISANPGHNRDIGFAVYAGEAEILMGYFQESWNFKIFKLILHQQWKF